MEYFRGSPFLVGSYLNSCGIRSDKQTVDGGVGYYFSSNTGVHRDTIIIINNTPLINQECILTSSK